MATITKRNSKYRVQIRKQGVYKSGTFRTKGEAQAWAFRIENDLATGAFIYSDITFEQLLDRYIREVTITKKSRREETLRLKRFYDMEIARVKLHLLCKEDFEKWRDTRLKSVSAGSVLRELSTISHLMNKAIEWKYIKENPLKYMQKPKAPLPRTRRYSEQEIERLVFVSGYNPNYLPLTTQSRTGAAMLFAIETAMRAGEICNAKWQDFQLMKRTLHIPMSKNGHPRDVPLSNKAMDIILHLAKFRSEENDLIFQLNSKSLDTTFRLLKERAGLADADLHFHDTRREALSRLSKKVEVLTLAKISGHRDIKILLNTYYAPDMSEIANLLD